MGVIERAVAWAIDTANDQSHGYSQANRWGPDYDCSSFVIQSYEQAGLSVKEAGASYTGNMRAAFIACGFVDVTYAVGLQSGYGIQAGDVLLNYSAHTCLAVGGGQVANCRTDEGNPQSGDQSGNEIRIQGSWNFPWDCVLRYKGTDEGMSGMSDLDTGAASESGAASAKPGENRTVLRKGMRGADVSELQQLLKDAGYDPGEIDGIYGAKTMRAVIMFQEDHGLDMDGVAGPLTMAALRDADHAADDAAGVPDQTEDLSMDDFSAAEKRTIAKFLRRLLDHLEM